MSFWLFHIPNLVLAAALYTLIGRFLLSVVFKPGSDKVIWRVFCQVTDPLLKSIRVVTPAVVSNGLVMVLAIFWMIVLRILLFVIAHMTGIIGPGAGGVQ